MKPTPDPLRWSERGSDAPHELAAGIRALRAGHGSDAAVAALGQRLAPQLAAQTSAGTATVLSPWLKLGGALLIAGALGLYVFARTPHGEPPRAAHGAPAIPATPPPAAEPAPTAAPAPPLPGARAELPGQRSRVRAASKPQPAHATRAPAPAASPAPEAELALLQRSQLALDRDPGAALALAEQHAREHPAGVFSQEREMLAMEALVKLRRVPAALARAERFVREYPASPHSERVRALLERFRMLAPAAPATIERDGIHPMDVPEATREP